MNDFLIITIDYYHIRAPRSYAIRDLISSTFSSTDYYRRNLLLMMSLRGTQL